MQQRETGGKDPLLLVEAALALVLFALFVYLFLLPVARPPFTPGWWTWPLLAVLFFALVGLDTWRRKRGRASAGGSSRGARPPRPDEPVPPAV